ncbi:MAG TPA: sulfite exporter TauE/SafE family protein [Cyclobacteriaceae bacterium]|nr:sulfite exporter TauE/SafE family protein [Cyclobacteriaceae bacterium]
MYYTAIIMGLAGSLHCAGMCSPLAMAIAKSNPFVLSRLVYNLGRIFTYALLGSVVATAGSLVQLAPWQSAVSLTLGAFFLLLGLGGISRIRIPLVTAGMERMTSRLKKLFGATLQRKSSFATFSLGMLNGLLPCGLTYLALSACLILPNTQEGFLFMLFFGLGTWPVMIGMTWILNIGFIKRALNLSRLSRIALIFVGCLLVGRVWLTHQHDTTPLAGRSVEAVCK